MADGEAVRDAVNTTVGVEEMVAALRRLHDLGAFVDFEPLIEAASEGAPDTTAGTMRRRSTQARN